MSKYSIGIYLRISVKDRDEKDESNSLDVQRMVINDYLSKSSDLKNCNMFTYCDDGFSGTDFLRPDVERLLEDVKNGIINCIVVKDISRFGRSYIEVGNYLEKIFPFLGVRFIAIKDDYDSNNADDVGGLVSAFKAILADIYAKDLSDKVKVAGEKYAKLGRYISASTPYGFLKSKSDKNTLVIDEEAAEIVRRIFFEYLNGKGKTEIARDLNRDGILTPMEYKRSKGRRRDVSQLKAMWKAKAIDTVLKNPAYIGSYTYGVNKRVKVGSAKTIVTPKEEWIVVPNAHIAIISQEDFDMAMKKRMTFTPSREYEISVLSTLVKCAICNHKLRLHKNLLKPYFDCKTRVYTDTLACKDTKIYVSTIHDILLKSIQSMAKSAVDRKKLKKSAPIQEKLATLKTEYKDNKKEFVRWGNRYKEMFQNKVDEKITAEVFEEESVKCTAKRSEITEQIAKLQEEIEHLENQAKFDTAFIDCYTQFMNITEIKDDVLKLLVKEILVYDSQTIEIKWNFAE